MLVVRFQGPRANGMPELHKLMPLLANQQAAGQQVALVTDGRLSGASGQVPAALHVTPEAAAGGALALLHDGDLVEVDAVRGVLAVAVDADEWTARTPAEAGQAQAVGYGLELFNLQRRLAGPADRGGSIVDWEE
ncbi:Phosphogluconate dehydratase [compost metagenome]